jgi:Kef-type K+ transport system membrane component KefB
VELLVILLVLLLLTRTFGEVAHRLGQPPLLGELIAGITLGMLAHAFADSIPILGGLPDNPVFIALTDLGIFFLMLYGGVELRASKLAEGSSRSFVIALGGLMLPLAVGFGLAWAFLPDSSLKPAQCLFVGTAIAITAVPVSIRVLLDLGKLESMAGKTIVAAAIIDDVLSLSLLALLTGILGAGRFSGFTGMIMLLGSIVLFFAITIAVGRFIVPRMGRVVRSLKTAEFEFTSLLLAALAFAVLAELLNLHFVLGAFVAGLLFERRIAGGEVYDEVKKRVSAITLGFLAPIFFASIGIHLDLSAVTSIPGFLLLLIAVAYVTKLIGAGLPAYYMGLSKRDSLAVGVGMSARGVVELIIANIALRAGLFALPDPPPPHVANLFSAIVIMAVVTTTTTPFALKWVFAQRGSMRRWKDPPDTRSGRPCDPAS